MFVYLFLPPYEQTSECETHQEATLKKKKQKNLSVKMYEWKNVDFFFF